MMGFGLLWMLLLILLPVVGIGGLIIWLISTQKKSEGSNSPLITGIVVSILVLLILGLVFGVILFNQIFRWFNFGPGGMMGNRFNLWRDTPVWMHSIGIGMHRSMPRNFNFWQQTNQVLSIDETENVVNEFLENYGKDDLAISEIMIFDNHGYAVITEISTGIGAFELLIDPVDKIVYPEYGPNRMWNFKYGMHGRSRMMGGHMGSFWVQRSTTDQFALSTMQIDPSEAQDIAQNYLNESFPGAEVSDHLSTFYGYYTIDVERDSNIFGMLSVNGLTGQVFYHHWHGDFIEMVEH